MHGKISVANDWSLQISEDFDCFQKFSKKAIILYHRDYSEIDILQEIDVYATEIE